MSELLRFDCVSKSYARGSQVLYVLREVSFAVEVAEVVSVLGMRGAGKTTLLELAAGIESPDAGEVRFEGRALDALPERELARLLGGRIAWAGRSGPGVPMRLLDYVAMPLLVGGARTAPPVGRGDGDGRGIRGEEGGQGPRGDGDGRGGRLRRLRRGAGREAYARAWAALERVGAQDCAQAGWNEISDWERALVEIAQGIAAEPRLLLVDDITDTLGLRESDELGTLLRSLARERRLGVLMSVSDAHASLSCDRIVTLAGGRLTEGSPVGGGGGGEVIEFPDPAARREMLGERIN